MDWWNDLTDWISSDDGWRVLSGAIIPFVAIVVAGIIAALIGRGATKRVVAMQEREARHAAVAAIVSAARKAATWGSLGHDERGYADHLAEDADIRLRLLPVTGAPLAANWAQHEIADIKKNSSTFSFQAEQSLAEFRDRLLEWQGRPSKARKLFKSDLERWKFDSPDPDADLIKRQQDWNADQADASRGGESPAAGTAVAAERPTPTTTSLRPALQRPASAPAGSGAGSVPAAASAPVADSSATTGTGAVASESRPGFSVNRGGRVQPSDPNATTPFSSTGATTPISDGDGATRVYGDDALAGAGAGAGAGAWTGTGSGPRDAAPPVRPTLGTPTSPAGRANSTGQDDDTDTHADAGSGTGTGTGTDRSARAASPASPTSAAPTSPRTSGSGWGSADRTAAAPLARPTAADAHVNRIATSGSTNTTSVPTRIADAPAEPADASETSEAPYTQPISASELRRRAADDDE